ncbi:hypothetical protein PsorP6_016330 [Peronosclerospora sorghi]|uniref:Uncharacterized protein n=1 Tax=Peronosclerospora sorghi TaxID=230839 RepID=A0ACC0VKX6_9STRA|nr:hypothetical protein PsorP6_016330 [Peronosclerospora sorghi]
MCKVIRPLAIAAVFVSAASSTLSIPVFSEGSETVIRDGEESSPPEAEGRRMLRGKNEANQEAQEERGRLPIPREAFEAFEASSSEALRTMNKNVADAEAQMKWANALFENHPVASSYAKKLRVKVDDVAKSLGILWKRKDKSTVNDDKLFLMAIGNEYFKADQLLNPLPPRHYATPTGHNLFRDYIDEKLFEPWKKILRAAGYKPNVVFNRMRLLHGIIGGDKLDINQLVDYAYMAMGSELLSRGALNADVPRLRNRLKG